MAAKSRIIPVSPSEEKNDLDERLEIDRNLKPTLMKPNLSEPPLIRQTSNSNVSLSRQTSASGMPLTRQSSNSAMPLTRQLSNSSMNRMRSSTDKNEYESYVNSMKNSYAVYNISSSNLDVTGGTGKAEPSKSVGLLLNYLSENIEKIKTSTDSLKTFENYTSTVLKNNFDTWTHRILKSHGWNGKSFTNKDGSFDVDACLHSLSNLYLSQRNMDDATTSSQTDEQTSVAETEKILSFLPNVLLAELKLAISSSDTSEEIISYSFRGAALLADISGFSTFAGTMCSRGVRGLNDLHEVTNGFLGHFVNIVYRYGGDVIAFAGDALLCVFVNDPYGCKKPKKQNNPPPVPLRPERRLSVVVEEEERTWALRSIPSRDTDIPEEEEVKSPQAQVADPYWNTECCVRALECAFNLRNHAIASLFTHMAVSYGDMKLALLGGHNDDWVYLLNGECISELSSCISDAKARQVVCTEGCFEEAKRSFSTVEFGGGSSDNGDAEMKEASDLTLKNVEDDDESESTKKKRHHFRVSRCQSSGNYLVESIQAHKAPSTDYQRLRNLIQNNSSAVIDASKLFVPRPVLSAIYSDSLDRIAELRQVVTMFLSLDSYSPELHKDPMNLQPFFLIVQECLHLSGGFLRQFLVDDKGCVVIAMWGVPQFSYMNNGARGLYCAANIRHRALETLQYKCSVGVTTGYGYCGSVGANLRRDYVVIGDQVNMAARLMSKAKGRLLVDAFTKQSLPLEGQMQLQLAETMKVKGSELPISPYSFQGGDLTWFGALDENQGSATVLRRNVRVILSSQLDKISNSTSFAVNRAMTSGMVSMRSMADSTHLVGKVVDNNNEDDNTWGNHAIFTVIMGLPGTGKSTAAMYFEQGARKRQLECVKFVCRPGDESRPYALIRKLFLELIGVDNFKDMEDQRKIIQDIVKQTYPFAEPKQLRKSEIILEIILGVEWSEACYESDDIDHEIGTANGDHHDQFIDVDALTVKSSSSNSLLKPNNHSHHHDSTRRKYEDSQNSLDSDSSKNNLDADTNLFSSNEISSSGNDGDDLPRKAAPSPNRPNFHRFNSQTNPHRRMRIKSGDLTFYNVLSRLLQKKRTVVIIEDAHFCDELSWKELHLILLGEDLHLAVLLTIRTPSNKNSMLQGANKDRSPSKHSKSSGNMGLFSMFSTNKRSLSNGNLSNSSGGYGSNNSSNSSLHLAQDANANGPREGPSAVTITKATGETGVVSLSTEFADNQALDSVASKYGFRFRPNNAFFAILAHEHTTIIEMNPLSQDEVREVLIQALKSKSVDPELVTSVYDITSGNAFWCKAIARFIRENGLEEYYRTIVRRGGSHNSLKALILNRIDRLKTEQQIVARHASIIGDEFSLSNLNAILPARIQPALMDSLEALQHHGLVCVVEDHIPDVVFAFQNQLIRNTIYDLTPPSDASRMHLSIAEYIEKKYKDNLRNYYYSLSYHFRNSHGRRPQALKYTVKSADQAISRGAFSDGLSYLQIARPLAVSRAELHVLLEVVNAALRDLSPNGLAETMRRVSMSFQNSNHLSSSGNNTKLQQGYGRLKVELIKTIESYNRGENKSMAVSSGAQPSGEATNDGSKTNSVHFRQVNRTNSNTSNFASMVNRQLSSKLTWQPSYVANKRTQNEKKCCMF